MEPVWGIHCGNNGEELLSRQRIWLVFSGASAKSAAGVSQYNVEELDIKSARTSERRREEEVFKIQDFKISDKYFAHRLIWSVQREREGMY